MRGPDDFAARKATGTAAEVALRDLFCDAGATVMCHQQNHDVTAGFGAAVAHGKGGRINLPDLTVFWQQRRALPFYGVEVKAKHPLNRGGWGWDARGFRRALAWASTSAAPVFYAIRDLSAAPLPAPGALDDPDLWHVASVLKLLHAPERHDDGNHHYWPRDAFLPLAVLLDGLDVHVQHVPVITLGDEAPMLL